MSVVTELESHRVVSDDDDESSGVSSSSSEGENGGEDCSSSSSSRSDYYYDDDDDDDDDDDVLSESRTMVKIKQISEKLQKHSARVQKDLQDVLSRAKSHANAHATSTKEHVFVHSEATGMYCESVEKAVDSTEDLMGRVMSVAAFAEPLRALAKRTKELRARAELLEKMCEEKGILMATPGKRGNGNGLSPHGGGIGGGLSALSPLRFFRSGSASPKKKNTTPPASPSRTPSKLRDVSPVVNPFAHEEKKGEDKKEEEEKKENNNDKTRLLKVPRPPLPPPPPPPSSSSNQRQRQEKQTQSSSSPTPFDPSDIIAAVVERKKIERLAELREIERVKEGKYGIVTPYENSPAETPSRKGSSEYGDDDRRADHQQREEDQDDEDVVAMDEVINSLGKM
jgi:hypothetical protein